MRACIAIAVWLASGRGAQAQPLNPAEVAFEKGRLLAEAGRHERACAAFELSQRLDPQFGTLFNLAGCYVNLGKVATAWQLYRELWRSDGNLERRAEAKRLVTELEPRVPTVRVRAPDALQSPTIEVFVGGTEVTSLLDVDIPFDPGRYVITASSPGYLPFRREIYVHPKEVASVDVELERAPALHSKPVVPARSSSRIGAKIAIATGAGLTVVSAVAGWRWYVNQADSVDPEASDRATRWATVTGLTLVFGLGSAVIGGVMLTEPRDPRALRVAPAVGSGSASVVVNGAF